jgi:hypothetical protein
MTQRDRLYCACLCAIAAGIIISPAGAQDAPSAAGGTLNAGAAAPDVSTLLAPGSRRYTAGIRLGTFIVQPAADASIGFDDNIFASPSDRKSDKITKVNASVDAVSNWSRHAAEFSASGGGTFYAENDDQNQSHLNMGLAGILDIQRGFWIKVEGKYARTPEVRGFGESTQRFDEPVQTQTAEGNLVVHRQFNRFWLELGGGVQRLDFQDASIAGVLVDQSFRNGTIYDMLARTGYEVSGKTSVFLEAGTKSRNFDDARFEGDERRTLVGFRYELTRLLYGEAAVGYLQLSSSGGLTDAETWSYRGRLAWDATPLMSVALLGSRSIGSPTEVGGPSNTVRSDVGVRVDYDIRRDVTLMAGIGYGWLDFVDIGREDTQLKITAGAEYEFRPSFSFWANYAFSQTGSDAVPDVGYDKNVVMLGLRAKY